jgi:hypothetical protein
MMFRKICPECRQQYGCEQNGVPRICYECVMMLQTGCPPMREELAEEACYVCDPIPVRKLKILTKKKERTWDRL